MKQFMLGTTAICALLSHSVPVVADIAQNGPVAVAADTDNTGDGNISFYSSRNLAATINDDAAYFRYNLDVSGNSVVRGNSVVDGNSVVRGNIELDGSIITPDGNPIDLVSNGIGDLTGSITLKALSGEDTDSHAEILLLADGELVNTIDLSATGMDGEINLKAGDNSSELTMSDTSATLAVSGTNGDLGSASIIVDTVNAGRETPRSINGSEYFDQSIILMTESTGVGNVGDIDILSGDDVGIEALDKISLNADNQVEVTALTNIEMNALDDIEMRAAEDFELLVGAFALGEDSEDPDNFPYSADHGGIIAIQGDHANRYVADENGKIVLLDSETEWSESLGEDTANSARNIAAGMSAQVLVKDVDGNARGLVVQENKTTLSGGQNAASLSLDENGATFSDPKNGKPIQVHGVADGTAEFDAVNVRQLYSGLAAVLAAGTPELRLEPGKTSAAVGVGYYGGYSGFGLGLGHMYDNGTVVSMSVGKATHSEVAVKGSVSWTW